MAGGAEGGVGIGPRGVPPAEGADGTVFGPERSDREPCCFFNVLDAPEGIPLDLNLFVSCVVLELEGINPRVANCAFIPVGLTGVFFLYAFDGIGVRSLIAFDCVGPVIVGLNAD
jgi:hypothetical protein